MSGLPWSFHFADRKQKIKFLLHTVDVSNWSDDIEFQPLMLIDADSYKPTRLFDVKPALPRTPDPATYVEYRNGDGKHWRYRNMLLPAGESLSTITEERIGLNDSGSTKGRVYFTKNIVIPALTEVIGGSEQTWMSITPMEIFTCRDGVRYADRAAKQRKVGPHGPTKKVVIAGLGLGWILQKVAALKSVKEIVVIEQSGGILDWYGHEMCAGIKKVKEVVQDDYWAVAENYPDHFHLIDIWPLVGEAYGDEHLQELSMSWWAWGYQFGEDSDMDDVLDEDEAISKQLDGDDEDDEDGYDED